MSQTDLFDETTITPIDGGRSLPGARWRPVLTVLWHPDVSRVGQRAIIEGSEAAIGRNAPMFGAAGGTANRPLADVCLSRQPALTITFSTRGASFQPGATRAKVAVQRTPLTAAREIDPRLLAQGIVITIDSRIALCLHLTEESLSRGPDLGMVGQADALETVRADIRKLGPSDLPVLIRGETGTGKELVAEALAAESRRKAGPFVVLNMATLPPATAVAELFGHERGAFTGAEGARAGHFAQADGGTLFLDEIGNTPPDIQAMLLRAVQTGEIVPLGSSRRARRVDVRLLAATDARLEEAIAEGRFSEPLYQRLSKAEIRIAPLRERRSDVGLLLLHFLKIALDQGRAAGRLQRADITERPWLGADEVARLALHDWPGNVRELESFAGKLVRASEGEKYARFDRVVGLLGRRLAKAAPRTSDARTHVDVAAISDRDFLDVFDANGCIPAATARALGISRPTVYSLMQRNAVRTVEAIPDEEILAALEACQGDRRRAAAELRVSLYALTARLTALAPSLPKRRASR